MKRSTTTNQIRQIVLICAALAAALALGLGIGIARAADPRLDEATPRSRKPTRS